MAATTEIWWFGYWGYLQNQDVIITNSGDSTHDITMPSGLYLDLQGNDIVINHTNAAWEIFGPLRGTSASSLLLRNNDWEDRTLSIGALSSLVQFHGILGFASNIPTSTSSAIIYYKSTTSPSGPFYLDGQGEFNIQSTGLTFAPTKFRIGSGVVSGNTFTVSSPVEFDNFAGDAQLEVKNLTNGIIITGKITGTGTRSVEKAGTGNMKIQANSLTDMPFDLYLSNPGAGNTNRLELAGTNPLGTANNKIEVGARAILVMNGGTSQSNRSLTLSDQGTLLTGPGASWLGNISVVDFGSIERDGDGGTAYIGINSSSTVTGAVTNMTEARLIIN